MIAAVIVLLALVVLAALMLWLERRRSEPVEFEEFRRAVDELEREIGAAFMPALDRLARQIERWSRR